MEILATTILALPTLGALALFTTHFDTGRNLSNLFKWGVSVGVCLIALILAWGLPSSINTEILIGNWFPISVTVAPLVINITQQGSALVIAVTALMASRAFNQTDVIDPLITIRYAALSLAALSNNLVTLLIGIGLADAMTIISTLRSTTHPERVMPPAILSGISLTLIFAAILVYGAGNQSLYYPLINWSERAAALALVGCLLRFIPLPLTLGRSMVQSSSIGGWILLIHLTKLSPIAISNTVLALCLACGAVLLCISTLSTKRSEALAALKVGTLCLSLTSILLVQSAVLTAAAITWLLGTTLVGIQFPSANQLTRRKLRWALFFARSWGGLCLIGFPLTSGLIGHAGLWATLLNRPRGALFVAIWFVAQVLLVLSALRLMAFRSFRQPKTALPPSEDFALPVQRFAALGAILTLALPLLVIGIWPTFIGANSLPDLFSRQDFAGWSMWIAGIGAGILLWITETHWQRFIGERDVAWGTLIIRDQIANFLSLNWLNALLQGALRRIANPFGYFFDMLESDGALIWAVVIVLLLVLVTFRPTP